MALFKATWKIRLWGLVKVPMLFFCSPSVMELTDEKCVIKIPLGWRTGNHLRSMYVGVLCAGADCAGGLMAMERIQASRKPIRLSFKDIHGDFIRRAEGDVFFTCTDGAAIDAMVARVVSTGERQNLTVSIVCTVPSKFGDEPVARFTLTLSLK